MMIKTVCCFLLVVALSRLQAEDKAVSFVITPPPVGYPVIAKGSTSKQGGANLVYLKMSMMEKDMTLLGASAFANYQVCPTEFLAFNGSGGASFLAGNQYDLFMLQLPFSGNIVFEAVNLSAFSLFLFGGATATAGLMNMTVTIPQWVQNTSTFIDDDTSLSTTTLTASAFAGAQANIPAGQFIISPFGLYTVTAGRYSAKQTSTMSYNYPSYSGRIEPESSTVLGFDLLYVPRGIALSSLFRNTKDYTLITVSLKWLLETY